MFLFFVLILFGDGDGASCFFSIGNPLNLFATEDASHHTRIITCLI